MYGGSVQGVFRELEPNSRLVLDWRFRWAGVQDGVWGVAHGCGGCWRFPSFRCVCVCVRHLLLLA